MFVFLNIIYDNDILKRDKRSMNQSKHVTHSFTRHAECRYIKILLHIAILKCLFGSLISKKFIA